MPPERTGHVDGTLSNNMQRDQRVHADRDEQRFFWPFQNSNDKAVDSHKLLIERAKTYGRSRPSLSRRIPWGSTTQQKTGSRAPDLSSQHTTSKQKHSAARPTYAAMAARQPAPQPPRGAPPPPRTSSPRRGVPPPRNRQIWQPQNRPHRPLPGRDMDQRRSGQSYGREHGPGRGDQHDGLGSCGSIRFWQ
jgi:hypothetical protein